MPFTNMPAQRKIDELRLLVGDVYCDMEWLADETYDWLLDKYEGSVRRASLDAARMILFQLARWTRERAGNYEVYGSEAFKNYRDALIEFTRNPNLSLDVAMPWAGGISVADMAANRADPDNVGVTIPKINECSTESDSPLDSF